MIENAALEWRYSRSEVAVCIAVIGATSLMACYLSYFHLNAAAATSGPLPGVEVGPLGLLMDISDHQWHLFTNGLPFLLTTATLHIATVRGLRRLGWGPAWSAALELAWGLYVVVHLHSLSALVMLAVTLANFGLCGLCGLFHKHSWPRRCLPALTWLFNVAALLGRDALYRFRFGSVSSSLAWIDESHIETQWSVTFPYIVLRMISFNLDYHAALEHPEAPTTTAKAGDSSSVYRVLQQTSLPPHKYSLLSYWAYLFYVPLYVVGPICTFNAWRAQLESPTAVPSRALLVYAARLLLNYALMFALLHLSFANAIAQKSRTHPEILSKLTCGEIPMMSLTLILFHWLKLLIAWRIFRLWALLAGVLTLENMQRCVLNNYSMQQLWRTWHCSFNNWFIRYLFIPLGGNRHRLPIMFLIFNFTAIWHDLDWRLLHWAWCVMGIILPESLVTWLFSGKRLLGVRRQGYYRYLCVTGWSLNILLLVVSAQVFMLGLGGVVAAAHSWWTNFNGLEAVWCLTALWCGCNLMLYIRHREASSITPGKVWRLTC